MLKILKGIFAITNGIKYLSYPRPNRCSLQVLNILEPLNKIENSTGNILLDNMANSMGLKPDLSGENAKLT